MFVITAHVSSREKRNVFPMEAFGGVGQDHESQAPMFKDNLSITHLARITQIAASDFAPSLALLLVALTAGGWFLGIPIGVQDTETSSF